MQWTIIGRSAINRMSAVPNLNKRCVAKCNNAIMQGPPGGKQTSRSHCCFVIVGVVAQLSVLSGGDQADHHHATWDSHTLAGAKVCDGIAQWSSQYWCLVFYIFGLEHRNCPNESHIFVCVFSVSLSLFITLIYSTSYAAATERVYRRWLIRGWR